jgi:hypothetical protein
VEPRTKANTSAKRLDTLTPSEIFGPSTQDDETIAADHPEKALIKINNAQLQAVLYPESETPGAGLGHKAVNNRLVPIASFAL